LGHFTKDCEKVKQNWAQGGFITKMNVTTFCPNLIMLRFKVITNGVVKGFFHPFNFTYSLQNFNIGLLKK
jgi:hypothetical protein